MAGTIKPSPIRAAKRTEGITYAVRDIVLLAQEVAKTGKEMLYLNIGDPNQFGFLTPPHLIEAVAKAMNKLFVQTVPQALPAKLI